VVLITDKLREIVVCYVGGDMPLYAFSLFLPTIINQVRPEFFAFIFRSESRFLAWYDYPYWDWQCLQILLF
jgi:hypothetical protein